MLLPNCYNRCPCIDNKVKGLLEVWEGLLQILAETCIKGYTCRHSICSALSRNLSHQQNVLRNLGIPTLIPTPTLTLLLGLRLRVKELQGWNSYVDCTAHSIAEISYSWLFSRHLYFAKFISTNYNDKLILYIQLQQTSNHIRGMYLKEIR